MIHTLLTFFYLHVVGGFFVGFLAWLLVSFCPHERV